MSTPEHPAPKTVKQFPSEGVDGAERLSTFKSLMDSELLKLSHLRSERSDTRAIIDEHSDTTDIKHIKAQNKLYEIESSEIASMARYMDWSIKYLIDSNVKVKHEDGYKHFKSDQIESSTTLGELKTISADVQIESEFRSLAADVIKMHAEYVSEKAGINATLIKAINVNTPHQKKEFDIARNRLRANEESMNFSAQNLVENRADLDTLHIQRLSTLKEDSDILCQFLFGEDAHLSGITEERVSALKESSDKVVVQSTCTTLLDMRSEYKRIEGLKVLSSAGLADARYLFSLEKSAYQLKHPEKFGHQKTLRNLIKTHEFHMKEIERIVKTTNNLNKDGLPKSITTPLAKNKAALEAAKADIQNKIRLLSSELRPSGDITSVTPTQSLEMKNKSWIQRMADADAAIQSAQKKIKGISHSQSEGIYSVRERMIEMKHMQRSIRSYVFSLRQVIYNDPSPRLKTFLSEEPMSLDDVILTSERSSSIKNIALKQFQMCLERIDQTDPLYKLVNRAIALSKLYERHHELISKSALSKHSEAALREKFPELHDPHMQERYFKHDSHLENAGFFTRLFNWVKSFIYPEKPQKGSSDNFDSHLVQAPAVSAEVAGHSDPEKELEALRSLSRALDEKILAYTSHKKMMISINQTLVEIKNAPVSTRRDNNLAGFISLQKNNLEKLKAISKQIKEQANAFRTNANLYFRSARASGTHAKTDRQLLKTIEHYSSCGIQCLALDKMIEDFSTLDVMKFPVIEPSITPEVKAPFSLENFAAEDEEDQIEKPRCRF